MAASHPETVKKILVRYQDNSIWLLLQKVIENAKVEKRKKNSPGISERTEEDVIEQKCLGLLQQIMELEPETVAPKLMHADSFINYLLKALEEMPEQGQATYA